MASMRPTTKDAYKLFHDGAIALSRMESAGMRIDEQYLSNAISNAKSKISGLEKELAKDEVYSVWRREYGPKMKLGAKEQLAKVIFDVLGYQGNDEKTATGKHKADIEAFADVDIPFIEKYRDMEQLKKLLGTYLLGVQSELYGGFLRPSFNLNLARSYRSTCSDPNVQNLPIRDPDIGGIIRRCFIPRHHSRRIVEIDYSGVEVKVAACYHKDPTMLKYINDKTTDMHRDMAADCYKLKTSEVSKQARAAAKSFFVFAQFYGDYYLNCSKNLWKHIKRDDIKTVSGIPLYEHLAANGIKELGACSKGSSPKSGTFEHHIQKVEDHFWNRRFPVYTSWKKSWWEKYQKKGHFETYTGFRVDSLCDRKQAINYPIQGAAFHCLLWSLIKLSQWLARNRMESVIICQIHDSLILDVAEDEFDDVVSTAKRIMTEDIKTAWPWITVPMEVEAEASPPGASWFEKKKLAI